MISGGQYAEAQSQAEDLLRSTIASAGNGPSEAEALALDLLIEARWKNGDASAETLVHAEKAVQLRRLLSREPPAALSLVNLGRVLLLAGRTGDAVAAFVAAVRSLEQRDSQSAAQSAEALDSLALGLIELGRYQEASQNLERALKHRQRGGSPDGAGMARTLELLSIVAMREGKYAEARAPLERALALRESQSTHPETALTFATKGDLLWLEGRPVEARDGYAKCLSISAQALRENHPQIAHCTRRLGNALERLGDMTGALALLEKAVGIAERSLGGDHPLLGGYLNDLAETYRSLMDYRRARTLYERALAIRERQLGNDHQDVATIVFNLALVSSELGDLVEARRHYDRAIAIWSGRLGADHPFVALAYASLAQTLSQHGNQAEALSLQRRALAIREQRLGPRHSETADVLGELARTLLALGQLEEAAAMSSRASAIWEQADQALSPATTSSLTLRAEILLATGDVRGAHERYSQALAIGERVFGPEHPNVADLRLKLATMAWRAGQARVAFDQALAVEGTTRGFLHSTIPYLSEREALSYGLKRPNGLNLILSLVAVPHPASATDADAALDAVVRARALVLDEMAARLRRRDRHTPELGPRWNAWISARQRLANLAVRGREARSDAGYQVALIDARREAERIERELAESSSAFPSRGSDQEIALSTIRDSLPPGSALVSFVRYDRLPTPRLAGASRPSVASYLAFVLQPTGQSIVVRLGPASGIESEITEWRARAIGGLSQSTSLQREERKLRELGERIRRRIWDPIQSQTRNADRIFIVPDAALSLLPFAALPVGTQHYLIDRAPTIHYLSAERDLVTASRSKTVGHGLLVVGGPAFDDASSFAARSARGDGERQPEPIAPEKRLNARNGVDTQRPASFRGSLSLCLGFESITFPSLPDSLAEATQIAGLWTHLSPVSAGPSVSRTLLGRDADERSVKQLGPGNRVIHMATHGFFLGGDCETSLEGTRSVGGLIARKKPGSLSTVSATAPSVPVRSAISENPLLLSGLALAGANQRAAATADDEDGILTAEEVASLDLSGVEWAVLSACDTGLGEIKAGEGVFGLRRAFQIAGAHTVIMSLWSVEDRAAMVWMRALYEGRLARKRDTAAAVREASLTVLRERRARGQSTHPFFWAGFVASGDWR
jgi:CHAT domain-containing protein/tetratricopeptide (TPR) repeat protein